MPCPETIPHNRVGLISHIRKSALAITRVEFFKSPFKVHSKSIQSLKILPNFNSSVYLIITRLFTQTRNLIANLRAKIGFVVFHGLNAPTKVYKLYKYLLTNIPYKVYNYRCKEGNIKKVQSTGKEKRAMGRKQKKKPIQWQDLVINALIDLIVGVILIIIDKLTG